MKPVTPMAHNSGLCEIMQHNSTEFALCRWDNEKDQLVQCHEFVHCRDFMNEVFSAMEVNKSFYIYGFSYSLDKNPKPDMENVSLLLKLNNNGGLANFQKNLHILTNIEEFLGWSPSAAEVVDYPNSSVPVVWVMGDRSWQSTAISFSFYTYLLKCLTYEIKDPANWMEEIANLKAPNLWNKDSMVPTVESTYMNPDYTQWLLAHMQEIIDVYPTFSGLPKTELMKIWCMEGNEDDWDESDLLSEGTISLSYDFHDNQGFVTCGAHLGAQFNNFYPDMDSPIWKHHCLAGKSFGSFK